MGEPAIGILCLQGDYEAHGQVLLRLGVAWRAVRRGRDLAGLHGLLLPGGESTTMWHFLRQDGLEPALRAFAARGAALYGTCAGAILLAREVRNPEGAGLGCLDLTVVRNGYGRQLESSVQRVILEDTQGLDSDAWPGDELEAVLIRAPRILRVGPRVQVRARLGGDPVWVEEGHAMATTFHPELGSDLRLHGRFVDLCREAARTSSMAARG